LADSAMPLSEMMSASWGEAAVRADDWAGGPLT
jgi:hypothetical protein